MMRPEELAEIRKRAEAATTDEAIFIVEEDVPKLLAEIERLRGALEDIADTGESYHEHYCRDIAREALRNGQSDL
ncbi:hypothetical protein [Neobacillus niacini]|uniref:hypothetical protein n=1 Tax=Neobacillus niacini TaxID=86668 RepID=UPI0028653330|nr:hypothetical protein [Neobacillus niacini]MDR7001631.1 hypothetical protein [Neobacillus niacini]